MIHCFEEILTTASSNPKKAIKNHALALAALDISAKD